MRVWEQAITAEKPDGWFSLALATSKAVLTPVLDSDGGWVRRHMIPLLKGRGDLNQQRQIQLRWIARYYVVVAQRTKQKSV